MLSFIGYNFVFDKDALNEGVDASNSFYRVKLQNGIFDHFNVTRDTSFIYNDIILDTWDYFTILNSNFEGNINAGNIQQSWAEIDSIIIKRREVNTFEWIVLATKIISKQEDFSFRFLDTLPLGSVEYEYGIFPTTNGIEGIPIVGRVMHEFNGMFLVDQTQSFKFDLNIKYGNTSSVHKTSVFEPIGSIYPILIHNSITDYRKGSATATIIELDENGFINPKLIEKKVKEIEKFLKNGRGKIIKDLNGRGMIIDIIGDITLDYDSDIGSGVISVSFEWAEIGDINNEKHLKENGLVGRVI